MANGQPILAKDKAKGKRQKAKGKRQKAKGRKIISWFVVQFFLNDSIFVYS
jgi:hypothetical protein